jgi:hypothetical protein
MPASLLLTPTKHTSFSADNKPGTKLGNDRIIEKRILAQRSRNVLPRKHKTQQPHRKGVSYYFSCMGGVEKIKKSPRISPEVGDDKENI